MATIAYKYPLLDPLDWGPDCQEQLFRMNRLWNTLVEIEHKHRTQYREIVGSDDKVGTLQKQIDAIKEAQERLRKERKALRQKAQRKVPTKELDAELKRLANEIQPLAQQTKEARKVAKEKLKEPLEALNAQRFEAVKNARNNSGLWWGNYNAVCASYDTARNKAMKEGAELRFRRFTAEGRFTNQIIGGTTPEEVFSGGCSQVEIDLHAQPIPGRKGKSRPRLSITVYTSEDEAGKKRRTLTFPLLYDRPLPEHCRVQQIVVTRRKLGTHWRYAVIFTCRIPDVVPAQHTNSDVCGINLGFRITPQKDLRIATFTADGKITEEAFLSKEWMDKLDQVETIRQGRDLGLEEIHAAMKLHWPNRPQKFTQQIEVDLVQLRMKPQWTDEEVIALFGVLMRAPKFGAAKLAALVLRWRDEHGHLWPQMLTLLEAWRRRDKREFEKEATTRDRVAMIRKEKYRLLARKLAQLYGVIRIGKIELRRMAQLEHKDGTENELHQRARRNRTRASLYLFQQELAQQASKSGSIIEYVEGPFTSTCNQCGSICAVTENLIHQCEHCSAVWDQDINAAINIFAAPRERSNGDENAG